MKTEDLSNVIVYFDNQYVPLRDARVSILTHALHYGTGVFDGIRGYYDEHQEQLFLVRPMEHYRRWRANSGILRIGIAPDPSELCAVTMELIRRNQFKSHVYVRPLAYKSAERIGVSPDNHDAFSVIVIPFGDYLDSKHGLHAGVVSWRRIEDNAIPARAKICGAYVNSALAGDEARRNGFDEAIFLTEGGHVAEGAACNIFLVRAGKLITPPGSENILEGITRNSIIELARNELHLEVIERPVDRSELYLADEMFFTGTAVEVAPIVRVDHHAVGSGAIGPVAAELKFLYMEATCGRKAATASNPWLSGRADAMRMTCTLPLARRSKSGSKASARSASNKRPSACSNDLRTRSASGLFSISRTFKRGSGIQKPRSI